MALVDVRDKKCDKSIMTGYHQYFFCHADKPIVLDLFRIRDDSKIEYVYHGSLTKRINGIEVHKGFYIALRDFIKKFDDVLVKLTREEEEFFKKNEKEIYDIYIKYHKGQKFVHELLEEKARRIAKQQEEEGN